MKKLTKLQKKWVAFFNGTGVHQLVLLLLELKVIDRLTFIQVKDSIIDKVNVWREIDYINKCKREAHKTRTYDTRPPKIIKPTRTRS